jgi:hypothetical protein
MFQAANGTTTTNGSTTCSDDCNGHGDCVFGLCQCYSSYLGPACQFESSAYRIEDALGQLKFAFAFRVDGAFLYGRLETESGLEGSGGWLGLLYDVTGDNGMDDGDAWLFSSSGFARDGPLNFHGLINVRAPTSFGLLSLHNSLY